MRRGGQSIKGTLNHCSNPYKLLKHMVLQIDFTGNPGRGGYPPYGIAGPETRIEMNLRFAPVGLPIMRSQRYR
jgi:hypothetical protein